MPVRKIRKSASSRTGKVYSQVAGRSLAHESALERDAFLISSFIPGLVAIEEQPIRIDSMDHHYHPDCRMKIEILNPMGTVSLGILAEIKYFADLRKQWAELWPRLELGLEYARALGWKFKVITELEIRGSDFLQLRFLRRFQNIKVPNQIEFWILETLAKKPLSALELLDNGSRHLNTRAEALIPLVWHLGAIQAILIENPPQISLRTVLFHPSRMDRERWIPCAGFMDALLAPWEIRP